MSRARELLRAPWVGPALAVLVVYFVVAAFTGGSFLRFLVLESIARSTVVVSLAAVGMTLVIIQGGIDLSVGSMVALVSVVTALALKAGYGPGAAVAVALLAGVGCGLVNGALCASLEITPFIVTLGTMSALRGVAKGLADERTVPADPKGLEHLMRLEPDSLMPFPPAVFIAVATGLIGAFALHRSRYGRYVVATGSSPATARLCGISIKRITLVTYTIAGLCAGMAGLMEFSNLTVGDPTTSSGLELQVIAAVVIGGGSLFGGQGSIAGSLAGALLMAVIAAGATHLGIANWIQEILTGAIIVVAVSLDRLRHF